MSSARPVRVARAPGSVDPVPRSRSPESSEPKVPFRPNRGATTRGLRLSLLYGVGIAAVYAFLVALTRSSSTGGTSGATYELELAGLLAAVLGVGGALLVVSSTPRGVLLGEEEVVIVGRFGGRHPFPRGARLRRRVVQRFPPGILSPVAIESIELSGWSRRKTFLLDAELIPADPVEDGAA